MDVPLINSHTKGRGCNNYLSLVVHEGCLRLLALLRSYASVVGYWFQPLLTQGLCQLFSMFACSGIDNSRFRGLLHPFDEGLFFLSIIIEFFDPQPDVGPIETLNHYLRVTHMQVLNDFVTYGQRSRGGQSQHAWMPQLFNDRA